MRNTINILGSEWEILRQSDRENPKLKNADGLCECYSKKIIIRKLEDDVMNFDNLNAYEHKVLRHEIVHAFLHESGLCGNCDWADNEEMVDWVACQYPKFSDAFHVAADILRVMLQNEESEE